MAEDEKPKRTPRVSVLERNKQTSAMFDDPRYSRGIEHPFGLPDDGVRLKDQTRMAHWFNADARNNRIAQVKAIGYDDVRPEDIVDLEELGYHQLSPLGTIVRGERGREVLLQIPKQVFHQRQAAKTKKNYEMMRDLDGEKTRALHAYAAQHGGTAAEQVEDQVTTHFTVTDKKARMVSDVNPLTGE